MKKHIFIIFIGLCLASLNSFATENRRGDYRDSEDSQCSEQDKDDHEDGDHEDSDHDDDGDDDSVCKISDDSDDHSFHHEDGSRHKSFEKRKFSERDDDQKIDRDVSDRVWNFKPKKTKLKLPSQTVNCGDVITSSITLKNDLICPATTGFALNIIGNNIVINGAGHEIIAPNAAAGIFAMGESITVTGMKVNGVAQGYGILAYDSPGIKITKNNFSANLIGIMIYAETKALLSPVVSGNIAKLNALFGIRTSFDGSGFVDAPIITNNDFSMSGSYAMYIKAKSFDLDGRAKNSLKNSMNGIYLNAGTFNVHDLSMKKEMIQKIQIFVDSASSFKMNKVDLSTYAGSDPNQEKIGLDLYRVTSFNINKLTAANNAAGVKFETELGVEPEGSITNSQFVNNSVAGILVISYDGTSYGNLKFLRNCFNEAAPAVNVLIDSNTILGEGSVI